MTKSIKKVLISFLLTLSLLLAFTAVMMSKPVQATGGVISLNQTAACRIKDELSNSGLKFTATVDKDGYRELLGAYDSVEAGIIIVPEDYVTAAGGYTLDKLSALSALEGKTYYVITETFRETETAYEFDNSIITIKPENYNRNFTGVGFIKVTEDDANLAANLDGFVEFDGAYYQYSNAHIANVYDVAFAAYEDRVTEETDGYFEAVAGSGVYGKLDSDEYDIIKNYLDGVINVVEDDGALTVKEGTYYKSPYTAIASADGKITVDGKGAAATGLTVNGVRQKDVASFEDGETVVNLVKNSKVTYNQDGSVTLAAGILGTGDAPTANGYGANENGYIAFEGNYGVGTYIETTFSASNEYVGGVLTDYGHDNIPQIILFADSVDGYEAKGKGLVLSTGVNSYANTYGHNDNYVGRYSVHGPNRMVDRSSVQWGNPKTKDYPLLTQKGLQADLNNTLDDNVADTVKTYKYVVGTFYNPDEKLVIRVSLFIKNGDKWDEIKTADGKSYTDIFFETAWTKADVEAMGTNIILMAEHKGTVYAPTTTFTYSAPYTDTKAPLTYTYVKSAGATVGSDGSLTMIVKDSSNVSAGAGQWAQYFNYYSFVGDYGVGWYLDFKFTGYNMPGFIFFADNPVDDVYGYASPTNCIAGKWTNTTIGRQGCVVLNGFEGSDSAFQVWGPNRWYGTNQKHGEEGSTTKMFLSYEEYPELTRKGQVENATKVYDLTIGTHLGNDGKVWMEVILSSNGNNIYHVDQSLNITEAEAGVGDIILLPQFGTYKDANGNAIIKGDSTQTVITSFTKPYQK